MSDSQRVELVHLEPDSSRFNEIMDRSEQRSLLEYNAHLNNCEHFSNYCVLDNFNSDQANVMRRFADALLSLAELSIVHQKDSAFHESLHDYNEVRERLKLPRENKGLQKKVDEKLNSN